MPRHQDSTLTRRISSDPLVQRTVTEYHRGDGDGADDGDGRGGALGDEDSC